MIIGLCGKSGVGKDTIADILVEHFNFTKLAFAKTLKDVVSLIFHWDRSLLEGSSEYSRIWRETIDEWWAERLNIPHLTPRWVLQHIGTETFRQHFHNDIWIASFERQLSIAGHCVITDIRFPNELDLIKKMGGFIITVSRPTQNITSSNHVSESFQVSENQYEFEIFNNSSIKDLESQVIDVYHYLNTLQI